MPSTSSVALLITASAEAPAAPALRNAMILWRRPGP